MDHRDNGVFAKTNCYKNMGKPKFFLGIEFTYGKDKIALSQRKYVLDLLQETGLLGCQLIKTQFFGIAPLSCLRLLDGTENLLGS